MSPRHRTALDCGEDIATDSREWIRSSFGKSVVEEREPRTHRVFEVNDVECGRRLVEVVAVAARIEAEKRTEEKTDRCLVRDHENILAGMRSHDVEQRR